MALVDRPFGHHELDNLLIRQWLATVPNVECLVFERAPWGPAWRFATEELLVASLLLKANEESLQ